MLPGSVSQADRLGNLNVDVLATSGAAAHPASTEEVQLAIGRKLQTTDTQAMMLSILQARNQPMETASEHAPAVADEGHETALEESSATSSSESSSEEDEIDSVISISSGPQVLQVSESEWESD